MATQTSPGPTVPQLMTAVKQLPPGELREFKRRFAAWQRQNGGPADEETALVQVCKVRLAAADERRLRTLIAKSERGLLSPKDLQDYRSLVRRVESLDVTRLAALTKLARLWGKPVRVVMEIIGWEGAEDETTSHPTRPEKNGSRSRRKLL